MKFSVEKKVLQQITNTASKLVGKFSHVILVAKDGELRLIINSDSYITIVIPGATVEAKGEVTIQQEVFFQLFSMRGNTIKAEYDTTQNKLSVVCGSKVSVYVLHTSKEDLKLPEVEASNGVELTSKSVALFRDMLKYSTYISPDLESHDYAVVSNDDSGFSIKFASTNSCAFYTQKDPISKKKFSITAPISAFKEVFNLCHTDVTIKLSENIILLSSDSVTATFPTLQDNTQAIVEEASNFLSSHCEYKKGTLILDADRTLEVLKSVRSISGGADIVDFKLKGNKVILAIESKYGKSKDACTPISTSMKDFEVEISELFLDSTLSMCSKVSTEVSFSLEKEEKLYKLSSSSKACSIVCLGPISK